MFKLFNIIKVKRVQVQFLKSDKAIAIIEKMAKGINM